MNKPAKDGASEHRACFNLYYFPEIPVDPSSTKTRRVSNNGTFRRTGVAKARDSLSPASPGAAHEDPSRQMYNDPEGQAYALGYREGVKAGISSERTKVQSEVDTLHNIVMQLEGITPQVYRACEREVVALTMAIAKKILKYEILRNQEVVKTMVEKAIQKADGYGSVTIRVSPRDYQLFRTDKYQVPGVVDDLRTVTFEEDKTLDSGDCVIETNLGDIDARIEKQLEAVEEVFRSQV
ncbi:MAG: FliH/SctL family protein [Thermodesulfobacteriota bacterium]|nr:FliH/SctL family protein [Thermodesulfobacteriota bacterium]